MECTPESLGDVDVAIAQGNFEAEKSAVPVEIDGCNKDAVWLTVDMNGIPLSW